MDHPRTRGVYAWRTAATPQRAGSSPHTRGLPAEDLRRSGHPGIIPAHAGFTPSPRRGGPRGGDHPRTRGVYLGEGVAVIDGDGSSPHTRGLLPDVVGAVAVGGIIPAHAGFTSWPCGAPRTSWDHPRTRGVYCAMPLSRLVAWGSSPHTRGLRALRHRRRPRPGIIPAHAGFTCRPRTRSRCGRDHPRTRGVYAAACASVCPAGGSSPHTRGLRGAGLPSACDCGIIPAHAGFTREPSLPQTARSDHPRTRGVYARIRGTTQLVVGSSPHTRGLPADRSDPADVAGIIPAHAGFTPSPTPPPSWGRDHPRTRGDYASSSPRAARTAGSSPHTRGLRAGGHEGGDHLGIIPAHAGFTWGPRPCRCWWPDHPRTRGVYAEMVGDPCRGLGSSPHTRGLLQVRDRGHLHVRIIPAHAGFTGPLLVGRRGDRDHPRTRGVYPNWASTR